MEKKVEEFDDFGRHWETKCLESGMTKFQSTNIATFCEIVEMEVNKNPGSIKSPKDMAELFNKELSFFENTTFTEDIYRLALQRLKILD